MVIRPLVSLPNIAIERRDFDRWSETIFIPNLLKGAKIAQTDLNPKFCGFPEGMTNPKLLRFIRERDQDKYFTPIEIVPEYMARQFLRLYQQDDQYSPDLNELELVYRTKYDKAERMANLEFWRLVIKSRYFNDLDAMRIKKISDCLLHLGRLEKNASIRFFSFDIWMWYLVASWLMRLLIKNGENNFVFNTFEEIIESGRASYERSLLIN